RLLALRPAHSRGHQFVTRYPKASDISSPPCLLRLLPAGAVAGWGLHPLESAALSRRTPAQDLAARPWQAAAAELWLGLGLELPGDLGVVDVAVKAGRDVDPRIAVLATRFEQQSPVF